MPDEESSNSSLGVLMKKIYIYKNERYPFQAMKKITFPCTVETVCLQAMKLITQICGILYHQQAISKVHSHFSLKITSLITPELYPIHSTRSGLRSDHPPSFAREDNTQLWSQLFPSRITRLCKYRFIKLPVLNPHRIFLESLVTHTEIQKPLSLSNIFCRGLFRCNPSTIHLIEKFISQKL